MKAVKYFTLLVLATLSLCAGAREKTVFISKNSFSAGAQLAHLRLSSDNSEILMLINPLSAEGRVTLIAPFAELAYKDNCSLGLRFNYLKGNLALDKMTLDLLNEGLKFELSDLKADVKTFGGSLYHRNYFGIDRKNRLAAFVEESLSLSGGRSDFGREGVWTDSFRASLSFSPGLMFFVMNNVSISLSLSMADISYNSVKCYTAGSETGHRSKFGTDFGLNLLGTNFGISFYF